MEIWILSEVIDIKTKYLSIYPICMSSFVIFPAQVFLPVFLLVCLSFVICDFYGLRILFHGFPGSSVVKNVPANAGDTSLIPDCGAAKPMCRKYWACALESSKHNCWTHMLQLLKPAHF